MNIDVTKDEVIIDKNSDKAHENEYKITECHFAFDDFTNSFQVKRAIFTILSTGEKYEIDIINNKCDIPIEVLGHAYETVKLGVYGYNIEIVDEEETLKERFSPSYDTFVVPTGSYEDGALSPEIITPSQYDIYSQALQEGLDDVDDKIDEIIETVDDKIEEVDTKLGDVDTKLEVVDGKIEDVDSAIESTNEAIERTNNLNLDVSDKVDGDVTVTLTKKDASTKTVVISDGTSLQFMWQGTSLGIKTDDMEEYTFVDLQGIQGKKGDTGEPFTIKKTYPSVAEMNADFNNMEYGDYVMIASSVEVEDNAKLYTRGESQWIFITDFSGATGIRGPVGATPNIQIGTVTSGSTPNVTRTGTDENPILNFVLQPGPQGEDGPIGLTGNGISSIEKTRTSGLVDTYTITFTNGNTTTFDVSNGNGIDRIEKTATVGNIDTYTIYFNDNSTSTFEVANGEVTKEELQEEVDRLSMIYNLFPTTSDEDTEMTLDGTGEVKLKKIGLKGNTYQESTTGKNLLNVVDGTYSQNGITAVVSNGEITLNGTATNNAFISFIIDLKQNDVVSYSVNNSSTSSDVSVRFLRAETSGTYGSANLSVANRVNENITLNQDYDRFQIRVASGVTISNFKLKPMIVKGATAGAYEPYTGENPAPNPDYPQDIQVVSGDNTIKVEGKNILDGQYYEQGSINDSTGQDTTNNKNARGSNYIQVLPNTTYTLSTNTSILNLRLSEYTSSKQNIQRDVANNTNKLTITTTANTYYVRWSLNYNDTTTMTQELFESLQAQLELGNQATTYEPYQSQEYKIDLPVENLWGNVNYSVTDGGLTYTYNNDGTINANGTSTGTATSITVANAITNNVYATLSKGTYTVSCKNLSNYGRLQVYTTNSVGLVNSTTGKGTFTLNETTSVILRFQLNSGITLNNYKFKLQLEKGSVANQYTPYGTTPIELCKIGTYQDSIVKDNGKWYLNKQIGKVVLDGSEDWNLKDTYNSINQFQTNKEDAIYINDNYARVLSNYYKGTKYSMSWTIDNSITLAQAPSANQIRIMTSQIDSVENFKTWLSTHNTTVYYGLQTPTITEITDTTLIEQLDNLENAYSYDTQTNITQTNDDMPFILDVEAILSLKNIFNS